MIPLSVGLYYALFAVLSLHGLHRAVLCLRLLRKPRPQEDPITGGGNPTRLPFVTVQLPIYNERYVAARLLEAAAALDWPADRLEIQVLDDSTDDTTEILRTTIDAMPDGSAPCTLVRRPTREGYKAGALRFGLEGGPGVPGARGEFVAIFDADFIPQRDFLRAAMPPLLTDPRVALVQARWDHLNRDHSALTQLQAVFLDAHFGVEHEARQRANHVINFNGTAGVWRTQAIADAGGWSHETLTEDLDLSFRAQICGQRFVYLHDLSVPAELPIEMNAFKRQQYRWAKGSIETARRLLIPLLRSRLRLGTKIEGAAHLLNNVTYVLILIASMLSLPVALEQSEASIEWAGWLDAWLLGVGIAPVIVYLLLGQLRAHHSLGGALLRMPLALALGIGLAFNNTRAVVSAMLHRRSAFERTPKYDALSRSDTWIGKRYVVGHGIAPLIELALAANCLAACIVAARAGNWSFAAFSALFASGYAWVGVASFLPTVSEHLRRRIARWAKRRTPRPSPTSIEEAGSA